MRARLVTPPTGEPVTLAEAKAHLRLETAEDDPYVQALITAARLHIEEYCWRGLLQQKWELVLEGFHMPDHRELPRRAHLTYQHHSTPFLNPWFKREDAIELPKGQLATLTDHTSPVTSVVYIDPGGAQQTLDPSLYQVDDVYVPGHIRTPFGIDWPLTRFQWDAVKIQYVVGWALADLPMPIKQALLLLVAQWYEFRTPQVLDRRVENMGFAVKALLETYRLNLVG